MRFTVPDHDPDISGCPIEGTACIFTPSGYIVEIIHLGDFWYEEKIRAHRAEIMEYTREISRTFQRVYRYLAAAAKIQENIEAIHSWAIDEAGVKGVTAMLEKEIFKGSEFQPGVKDGKVRKLFASAITPAGLCNYLPTVLRDTKVYELRGKPGTGTEKVLKSIMMSAVERGMNVEAYYCPMNPEKPEHLLIPDHGISITTHNDFHWPGVDVYCSINLDRYLDVVSISEYNDILDEDNLIFRELLNKAIGSLARAKALHDKLEEYYTSNMDFDSVQRCFECALARILEYAGEVS